MHFPIVTTCIILTNFFVFALELRGGDAFVLRWAAVAGTLATMIRAILIIVVFVRITLIPAALLIVVWFFFNVGSVAAVQTGGVAYVAHVGGFVFGGLLPRAFLKTRGGSPPRWFPCRLALVKPTSRFGRLDQTGVG
jgi:membrane associated rhomboid family serine protease